MKAWLLLLSLILVTVQSEEIPVRLAEGRIFEAGLVEVCKDGAWGLLCDRGRRTWDQAKAHLVCQQLGFPRAVEGKVDWGDSPVVKVPRGARIAATALSCNQGESQFGGCSLQWGQQCPDQDAVSVVCQPQSRSACGQGAQAFLNSCYKISEAQDTFVGAVQQCQRMKTGASLVEITSAVENRLVERLLDVSTQGASSFWTGGVVNRVLGAQMKFWHGSQQQIEFDNMLDVRGAEERPKGIVIQKATKAVSAPWATVDFDQRNKFICEFQAEDIGCLEDDDPEGLRYNGAARFDKNGKACMANTQCRNPDEDELPYCFIEEETPSYCNIPSCTARSASPLTTGPTLSPACPTSLPQNNCFKEEFACRSGCISKQHVCDGVNDCTGGEDETGCRIIASLFSKEEGYRLQGVTAESGVETTEATEEECAKLCYYSKKCCQSFSMRPGKDGKKDLCLLSTVFENQVLDTLVQKGSWNFHKLNDTDSGRRESKCQGKRWTNKPPGQIETLRLRNMRKGELGRIVEVSVGGTWGALCDNSFMAAEANIVCRQMGYPLGAKEVIKSAGSKIRDGNGIVHGSINCYGEEKSLADCSLEKKQQCRAEDTAGVVCREVLEGDCESYEFQCTSGECIDINRLCDGTPQCSDGSDEDATRRCGQTTQARLVQKDNYGPHSGVLEVRHKGVWGTVCNENFKQGEAAVFCRMMGYDGKASFGVVNTVKEKKGSWPIWISMRPEWPDCQGTENSIEECHKTELWSDDDSCHHAEDVVLTCQDSDPEFVPLDASRPQRAVADYNSKQIVNQCGLWRPAANKDGVPIKRIAGGVQVPHGTLPWQASIRLRGPATRTFHHCGAVIISPFHLLTTAHCLWDYRDTTDIYFVRVGDNVIEVIDEEEEEFNIEKIDFHEEFGIGPYLNNDIAVIHIKRKGTQGMSFGDKVSPACLPPQDLALTSDLNVTVSGWGKNGYDQSPRQSGTNYVSGLNMVEVPIIPRSTCREEAVYGPEKISLGMFCAGLLEGGLDTCQGDSGGPAVSYLRLSKFHETRATLVGLTSWGYGCGRENKPGVYTKVSKYVDWVYEKTRGDM